MMNRFDEVRIAMAAGWAFVCATCKRFHEGKEFGLERCTAREGCGSPIVGDTFHEYEGPLTDFLRFCFVCGDPPTKGLKVAGHTRMVGACQKHYKYVMEMAPTKPGPRRLPLVPRLIVSDDRTELVRDPKPADSRTLDRAMKSFAK